MSKKNRELPKPPEGPFSPGRRFGPKGEGSETAETADRMTMAMMEGRLEEFMKENFGDTPYAENLAMMMLGASGMLPAGVEMKEPAQKKKAPKKAPRKSEAKRSPAEVPAEVLDAAKAGDVERLKGLLSEHVGVDMKEKDEAGKKAVLPEGAGSKEAVFDKTVMDTLIKIASENNVSVDWVISRALKLYSRDYITTGRI